MKNFIKRITDRIHRKPLLVKPVVSNRFILLRGVAGNVFWTTDDGSNHEKDGFTVLHRGSTPDEMVKEWDKYHSYL